MEREISVCMTNFALILNALAASYKGRNEYISLPMVIYSPSLSCKDNMVGTPFAARSRPLDQLSSS